MCLLASLARRETATALESNRHNTYRRNHKDEALDSIPDARRSSDMRNSATDLGCESRPGGAGFFSHDEQRQDRTALGLSRKVRRARVAQQWLPLRGEALQQRQHAAAAKTVDRPECRLVHDHLFGAG